jgi:hypothetical protein
MPRIAPWDCANFRRIQVGDLELGIASCGTFRIKGVQHTSPHGKTLSLYLTTKERLLLRSKTDTILKSQEALCFGSPSTGQSTLVSLRGERRSGLRRASRKVNWKPNASPLRVALGFHRRHLTTEHSFVFQASRQGFALQNSDLCHIQPTTKLGV